VVYVNYGSTDDFETLTNLNITLEGKIALVRYGSIFRGTKAMIAQQYGIVGMLIYSDPADDGYAQGPVYPEGPWRSNSSVQRGSVLFLSVCPGNPTRPVCVSEPNRESYSYTQLIPSIPVQPLSYADALPILQSLASTTPAPENFIGALPITYYLGPGPGVVRIKLEMNFVNTTIWNVVGRIAPDGNSPVASQQVLIGNHRDAWVFGAVDPNSGTAMLLEVARAYGELLKQGWKPQREMLLLSWDGEEYGLLVSCYFHFKNSSSNICGAYIFPFREVLLMLSVTLQV
jgi:N-acetylated-alpha-linked acidic dipeptidase